MRVAAAAAVVVLAACGGPQSPSASVEGSPGAATTPRIASAPVTASTPRTVPGRAVAAVLMLDPGGNPTAALLDGSGEVVASAPVRLASYEKMLRGNFLAPLVSASSTRLYYLDGGDTIRWLRPDGSTGESMRLSLGTNQVAYFAVSTDDRQIAVSTMTITPSTCSCPALPSYAGMNLAVSNLDGSGRHEIFTSRDVAEFPAGWWRGQLVLGVGPAICCQAVPRNAVNSFTEYHVASPGNGDRRAVLCAPPATAVSAPGPGGALCFDDASAALTAAGFDGSAHSIPYLGPAVGSGALSPDGTEAVVSASGLRILRTADGTRLTEFPIGAPPVVVGIAGGLIFAQFPGQMATTVEDLGGGSPARQVAGTVRTLLPFPGGLDAAALA